MPFICSVEGQFAFGKPYSVSVNPYNPSVYTSNLQIWVDAASNTSYPGSGTTWSNLVAANAGTYWYTLSNSPPSVSTIVVNSTSNVSLFFDGINDYATPNTSLLTLAQANSWNETREYWVYWPGAPGCLTMESGSVTPDTAWYDAQIALSNGNLSFAVWSDMTAKIVTTSLASNTWNHIIFQHNKTSNLMMGYVNGTLLYSNASVPRTTPDSAGFGYFPILMAGSATNFGYGSASYLRGALGVYRWYNQILTGSQISSNFNAERVRFGVSAATPASGTSVLAFARNLAATFSGQTVAPTAGGALTLNSAAVGNYEYAVAGTTTVSAFSAADWFSSTKDTVSSWIVVNGNLTINAGQTFTPSVRKLFTVLYVSGNLVCNGTISMTARGANHSGTGDSGGATTAADIRIGTGTFSAVVNPQVPAAGSAGGSGRTTDGINSGTAGANGGTGGGGGGYWFSSGGASGSGSAGTSFSGGVGGGSQYGSGSAATSGGTNGGKGGNAGGISGGGGAGNLGGTGIPSPTYDGTAGTGGTLIVICAGTLSGSGSFTSSGSLAGNAGGVRGGDSGGGSITILYGTDSSTTTTSASGQNSGGAGTARKLAIGAN